jgi:hypothetical protein
MTDANIFAYEISTLEMPLLVRPYLNWDSGFFISLRCKIFV